MEWKPRAAPLWLTGVWILPPDVDDRAGDDARRQRFVEVPFCHDWTTCNVNQHCIVLHPRKTGSVNQSFGLWHMCDGDDHKIALGKKLVKLFKRVELIDVFRGFGITAAADHACAHGMGACRYLLP